ncbi:MAG: hypothetical protein WC616_04475 [Candidatus Omnitrophota bacterium]
MTNLEYHNIKVEKYKGTNQLVLKGEITNGTGRHYSTVAVRVILFIKNIPTVNEVFVVNDLPKGATKAFERKIFELSSNQVLDDVTRYEIFTDNCY